MTGGVAYIREWAQLNADSVVARPVPGEDLSELRFLVEEHVRRTGSVRGREILADWEGASRSFQQIVPIAALTTAPADAESPSQEAVADPKERRV
jgi:glutamate synthase domain-containing protein 3